ncbi:MAG: hypothetical protein RSB71_03805 [Bacilli bacterium]
MKYIDLDKISSLETLVIMRKESFGSTFVNAIDKRLYELLNVACIGTFKRQEQRKKTLKKTKKGLGYYAKKH